MNGCASLTLSCLKQMARLPWLVFSLPGLQTQICISHVAENTTSHWNLCAHFHRMFH